MSKDNVIEDLRKRVKNVPVLEDEPDFITKDETIIRFLKAREWNLKDAEKQLLSTVEWRRKTRPLLVDCDYCHKRPGLHSLRQVGFDESGRPVIYSSFSQASTSKNSVHDSIVHVTYLLENAKRCMKEGVTTFVLIIDCSGVTIQACNPKLGYEVTQILSNYYPERLGQVFCVNHSPLFQSVWNAIKVFIHPNTARKVKLVKKKAAIENFEQIFNPELTEWVLAEMTMNKTKNITERQRTFWLDDETEHDPRGCPSYVAKYCNGNIDFESKTVHKPHPNIIDALSGRLTVERSLRIIRNSSETVLHANDDKIDSDAINSNSNNNVCLDEWENLDDDEMIGLEIPDELKISEKAITLK